MTGRAFVDTNVWVYAVDDGEPAKQALARAAIAPEPDKDLVVSAQVLGEFFVTVRRRFAQALPEADAIALVERMRQLPVVAIDGDLVAAAIASAASWQVSYWDALIVEAARAAGAEVLLTEDLQDGWMLGGVTIVDPFRGP